MSNGGHPLQRDIILKGSHSEIEYWIRVNRLSLWIQMGIDFFLLEFTTFSTLYYCFYQDAPAILSSWNGMFRSSLKLLRVSLKITALTFRQGSSPWSDDLLVQSRTLELRATGDGAWVLNQHPPTSMQMI